MRATVVDGKLTMLYKLAAGPTNRSFGVDAAAAAGFPPAVVERARELATEYERGEEGGRGAAAGT